MVHLIEYTEWLMIFCALSLQNTPMTGRIRFTGLSRKVVDTDTAGYMAAVAYFDRLVRQCGRSGMANISNSVNVMTPFKPIWAWVTDFNLPIWLADMVCWPTQPENAPTG